MTKTLDAVMIGRSGVDLYGDQIGGRLEDMGSFSKYIGGSPTNTSIGAARLGMKTALISRVGDDAMGRFIRHELTREGVATQHLKTDEDRMTALVLLGIRDKESFPLIFYRENCADMALCEADIDEGLIASARAVVTSGTHFSTPATKAANIKALTLAKKHGSQRWIDLDYRPVLWGMAGKGDGETRFVASDTVTAHLRDVLSHMDVVVGTEEEIHIAGGSTDTITCLKAIRAVCDATFVVKLGAMGCAVFEGQIPDSIEQGLVVPGFPIEVFNVLGAGDAFMGGLVTGALMSLGWQEAALYANACGAFAVSRHACAPSYPSMIELQDFLAKGSPEFSLRLDKRLEQLHWSTTRQGSWPQVLAFAFDHRSQLEALSNDTGQISAFKQLCARVTLKAAKANPDKQLGVLCDHRFGQDALDQLTNQGLWIATPIELPSSCPIRFEGGLSLASTLKEWPREHVVKCLIFAHPDDDAALWAEQLARIQELAEACRTWRLELLLEIIPPKGSSLNASTVADSMEKFYDAGVYPDWWKLEAPRAEIWDQTWANWNKLLADRDPYCRGIVLLGLAAPLDQVLTGIERARSQPLCKGFAVGRSIFGDAAQQWFSREIDDDQAKAMMLNAYQQLIDAG